MAGSNLLIHLSWDMRLANMLAGLYIYTGT